MTEQTPYLIASVVVIIGWAITTISLRRRVDRLEHLAQTLNATWAAQLELNASIIQHIAKQPKKGGNK